MLKAGGHTVIIFPCGNKGSFLDRMMNLIEDAWRPTADGQKVLAFEMSDGHVRRMTSQETIGVFKHQGVDIVSEYYSGHLFGTLDWLCGGTGPASINKVFAGKPKGAWAKLRLNRTRRAMLATHTLIQKQSLDVAKKRNPFRQSAVHALRWLAGLVDRLLVQLSAKELKQLLAEPVAPERSFGHSHPAKPAL